MDVALVGVGEFGHFGTELGIGLQDGVQDSDADMAHGLVLGLKPKPDFLSLFNLGEPVTTGDAVGDGAELNCI